MTQEYRGQGILMRRGSAATKSVKRLPVEEGVPYHDYHRRGGGGGPNVNSQEQEQDQYEGVWMYPELMDLVALVAALCLGVATTAVFSFTMEDIRPADERYLATRPESFWRDSYPVSQGLMTFAGLSTCFSSFALVMAVFVRIILTYVVNMDPKASKRQFLLKWANPLSVVVVVVWDMSMGFTAVAVYYMGWVAFPPEIAHSAVMLACGGSFVAGIFVMLGFAIYLVVRSNKLDEKDKEARQKARETVGAERCYGSNPVIFVEEEDEEAPAIYSTGSRRKPMKRRASESTISL